MSKTKKEKSYIRKEIKKRDKIVEDLKAKIHARIEADEEQRIITSKVQERVNMQAELEGIYCKRVYLGDVLTAMQEELELTKDNIMVHWEGIKKPRKMFISQAHLEHYNYKQLVRREEYLKNGLKAVGFNDEQIEQAMLGRYISDHATLMQMEKDKLAPEIAAQEALNDELIAQGK